MIKWWLWLFYFVIKILWYIKKIFNFKIEINVIFKEVLFLKWNLRMYEDNVKFNNNIIKRDV